MVPTSVRLILPAGPQLSRKFCDKSRIHFVESEVFKMGRWREIVPLKAGDKICMEVGESA